MDPFIDPVDKTTYQFSEKIWCSASGRPLMVTPLEGIHRSNIDVKNRSIWRYSASLPLEIRNPVSLGEGCTPLINSEYEGCACRFKLEWFSPTGSFKDRGASALISFLKQQGISTIIEDSSGNGGAAIAAYSAAAGINAKILVPESTRPAKIAQIKAYGAEIILIPGSREATEKAAIDMASEFFYASHNWHPFFLQGTKTLGYEIWEDLGFRAPDNIIIPTSAGSNLLGCYIAFRELVASGESNKMPRLFVSQPANCAPLHASFQAGADDFISTKFLPTIAEGTAIKGPIRLKEMLYALRDTNGGTVAIEESEIIDAALKLAKIGLYIEPSSAHAAAAVSKLYSQNILTNSEETVVVLTGSGLKTTEFYTKEFNEY